MYFIVLATAILIISAGLISIIQPGILKNTLKEILAKNWLWPISILRIILGTLFIFAADEVSSPMFIKVMGLFIILAGISVPIFGVRRLDPMIQWFLRQKEYIVRIWGFLAVLFGIAVALAGMPA